MIDAHLHVWDPADRQYPWLAAEPVLNRAFLLSDLDSAGLDVDGFVVVEAGCLDGWAELEWLDQYAQEQPAILGVVAQVPLERGPSVATLLAATAEHPRTVGIRRNLQDEPPGFILAAPMVAGVRQLAAHNLPFDACVREHQLRELTELVDRCPGVMFVLDHLGKPDIRQRRRQPWFDDLAALARRPNVAAKLSGLTTEADHAHWHSSDIAPYLTHAIDVFGPDRCLFGGDWPVATLATTYQRWLAVVMAATTDLTDAQRSAILGDTAARIYRVRCGGAT